MSSRDHATVLRMGLLALLWGSGYLLIKLSLDAGLSPTQLTFARCVFASLTLLAISHKSGHRLPRGWVIWGRLIIAALFCNFLPFTLLSLGEQTVGSGTAGVLNATTPLWSALFAIALRSEGSPGATRLTGLLLGFLGTVVIFAPWHAGMTGWRSLAILGAAMSYAIAFAYMARALTGRGTAPIALSAGQMLAATGLSALALPAGGLQHTDVRAVALLTVAILGVFATGVTFYLNYRLIADEGATTAATVGYLLPIVSVVLGALTVHERITLPIIGGMFLILAGVAMTKRDRPADASARCAPSVGKPPSAA